MADSIKLTIDQDDETKETKAIVHMPGQEPLVVATLCAALAANKSNLDSWAACMKWLVSHRLIDLRAANQEAR